jgi:AraC family transcriptional activator of pobA
MHDKLTAPSGVPRFALFGEPVTGEPGPLLHIESIRQRSRPRGWEIHEHTHEDLLQAIIVRSGWVELRMDGHTAVHRGPVIVCVPPGVVHAYRFDPAVEGDVLSVSEALFGAVGDPQLAALAEPLHAAPMLLQPGALALRDLAPLLAQIRSESSHARTGRSLMLGWLARCLLLWLQRLRGGGREVALPLLPATARLLRFRQLVEREFHEHRDINHYARALGLTERALRRVCHELVGVAPGRIIDERLALEARRRLTYTPEPVAAIGYDLGFEDPAYFSRFVRRMTGKSPRALRLSAGAGAVRPVV